ncbi:hypothetical protein HYC85_021658 [Camellia sinensis]|uniref:Uncharacterized protein n=1 Tax=Camellia sinensis TaxID=4442 RepID=A0A7J7GKQ8_CAMSI|nr:hypothetical protein HYC85_021658 [Camellia sinensis]
MPSNHISSKLPHNTFMSFRASTKQRNPSPSHRVRSVATLAEAVARFDKMDLAGGTLVPVQGLDSPLYALEVVKLLMKLWQINPDKAREEFRPASQKYSDSGVRDLMDSMGLGMLAEQVLPRPHKLYLTWGTKHY